MDFWSRLVGGSGRPNKQASPKQASPQQRLDRFKRVCSAVLQTCSRPQQLGQPGAHVEQLVLDLGHLSTLLREELRSPAPYTCLSFAAANQIYGVIGRAASACKDERIILEAVTVFSILIDSEMEGFVSNRSFARALMRFSMRVLDSGHSYVSTETESQLVEVLFNIAAKIRLEPEILSVWFAPSGRTENEETFVREKKSFVGITQKDDFPLCYLFMDRVHHEGRIGDFARTGLLYIFESASRSVALDQWIVASDLPTLMASALGALYSQLSRELSLLRDTNDLPLLLAMSDYTDSNQDTGVETIASESHKAHMATFLSDLTFWQDILDHCRSVDVKQTLLDHFQILFLQQLLYPSLIQSSDTDGGSSVAVMTYLSSILQTLTDEGLANMLLTYLLGTQTPQPTPPARPASPSVMRRRSSLMIITAPPTEEERYEPSLFNLVDLIHNGLQSRNQQTTFAALKLFTTILTLQPSHALGSLVRLDADHRNMPDRIVGALDVESRNLMHIAASIGGTDGLNEAFDGVSQDVRKSLDANMFRHVQSAHTIDSRNNSIVLSDAQRTVSRCRLNLNDTGTKALMRLVRNFLSNSVDTNLALTETIIAICMSISIDVSDLIAIRPDRYNIPADNGGHCNIPPPLKSSWMDPEETDALQSLLSVARVPTLTSSNTPIMLATLRIVEVQVSHLRQSLSRFDALLSKRKSIIQTPEQTDALFATPVKAKIRQRPMTPAQTISRHASPETLQLRIRFDFSGKVAAIVPPKPLETSRVPSRVRGSPAGFASRATQQGESVPAFESSRNSSVAPGAAAEEEDKARNEDVTVVDDDDDDKGGDKEEPLREVSLSHVLTNIVVLQNFVLELVAVLQLRARVYEGEYAFLIWWSGGEVSCSSQDSHE
ncbi:hypothetical protein ANO11243_052650 [Dothideomycetidae sp. 11243]|nr:hypothetical protein ANO11243_052650 [fungal sp. No.11243]